MPSNGTIDLERAQCTDRLTVFREEVGITDILSIGTKAAKRTAQNIGIYRRVITAESNARTQYYASACLINSCLLLQIVFAAVLTSLGAANGSHLAITAVGAANTVIAGLLSFTKGQGLPNRLMQYQNALRKVREYIEQRERDFAQLSCKLDLDHEIQTVMDLYESVRQNDEANDPNAYHNSLDLATKAAPVPKDNLHKISPSLTDKLQALEGKMSGRSASSHVMDKTGNLPEPDPKDVGNCRPLHLCS